MTDSSHLAITYVIAFAVISAEVVLIASQHARRSQSARGVIDHDCKT